MVIPVPLSQRPEIGDPRRRVAGGAVPLFDSQSQWEEDSMLITYDDPSAAAAREEIQARLLGAASRSLGGNVERQVETEEETDSLVAKRSTRRR